MNRTELHTSLGDCFVFLLTVEPTIAEAILTSSYQKYLTSPEWYARVFAAKTKAGGRCQVCNSDNRITIHHRTYERLYNELPEDLTALCRSCHFLFHKKIPPAESLDTSEALMKIISDISGEKEDQRPTRVLARKIIRNSNRWPLKFPPKDYPGWKDSLYSRIIKTPTEKAALSSLWNMALKKQKNVVGG